MSFQVETVLESFAVLITALSLPRVEKPTVNPCALSKASRHDMTYTKFWVQVYRAVHIAFISRKIWHDIHPLNQNNNYYYNHYFVLLYSSKTFWIRRLLKKSYIKNGISYHNIFNNLLVNVIHWIAVDDSLTSYCLKFGLGVSIEVWSNLWGYLVSQLSDNIMQAFWCSGSGVYVNEDFIKRLSRTSIKCRNDQNKV